MTNWKDIHPDFTEELQREWEERGFKYGQVKRGIKIGLEPHDVHFAQWLRDVKKKYPTEWLTYTYNCEELREEYEKFLVKNPNSVYRPSDYVEDFSSENEESLEERSDNSEEREDKNSSEEEKENWTDIHENFGKEYSFSGTYQQQWELANITYEEAKEWIELSFEPYDYEEVKKWKNLNLFVTETKTWLEVGLDKYDSEFVSWLINKHYTLELVKNNLKQLRSDYNPYWLTKYYSNKNIKVLNIRRKNLKGELNLSQYQQLERLDCSDNKLTNIILPTSLKKLDLRNNNFNQDLTFLVPFINLEELNLGNEYYPSKDKIKQGIYNKFTGSLDYLSDMEQLKELDISYTDINEVNIDKLPRSLKKIEYSTNKRPDCKLTALVPLLDKHFGKFGRCLKCYKANTSERWCHSCSTQEWQKDIKNLTGQELVKKFVQQRQGIEWIPYEQFTNIEYLAEGGFSKVYRAEWEKHASSSLYRRVVLKSLTNSQSITLEFLSEVSNVRLVHGYVGIIKFYGISQDPETKNYVMVMEHTNEGDLGQYLQNKTGGLSLKDKFEKSRDIACGLEIIHKQNLVHCDLHSGNVLNDWKGSCITDLGLCRPTNEEDKEKKYGVPHYMAPEVLQGQPYTQASDIYSFGIVAYELFANAYPYSELKDLNDVNFSLKIIDGYRPNLDNIPTPQELKDLIKRCWDADPKKRPSATELKNTIYSWNNEIKIKKNTGFYRHYQETETEYNSFSQNNPYKIHPNIITTSRLIDTSEILSSRRTSVNLTSNNVLNIGKDNYQTREYELSFDIETPKYYTRQLEFDINKNEEGELVNRTKRQLSVGSQNKNSQGETKSVKLDKMDEKKELYSEPMEIEKNEQKLRAEYQTYQTQEEISVQQQSPK